MVDPPPHRRTLDYWKDYLRTLPRTIECPEMCLLSARDHEAPIFAGPGHIDLKTSTEMNFTMFATPANDGDALRRLARLREDPYDLSNQFRLTATDYQGSEWTGGWTQPRLKGMPRKGWPLTGDLSSLVTHASHPWVAAESSVELVFEPKFRLPMEKKMVTVTSIDGEEIERRYSGGRQNLRVLDSEITFFYPVSDDSLWVTARTSGKFGHPYAEDWLSEPLRILLGQLAYPRLVARNFGDGRAQVWIRPSPRRFTGSGIAALLGEDPRNSPVQFWRLYSDLLTFIAGARDEQDNPNLEKHEITRFYEEIIQATQGSRWVLCMTLASVGEGLLRMLMNGKKVKIDHCMKALVETGVLVKKNQTSWTAVRHDVMHGKLVSPWSSKEQDERILDLGDLVHRLTREIIRRGVKSEKNS